MKKAALLVWVLGFALSLTAQHKHNDGRKHQRSELEKVTVTVDPFGNVVETYDDPIPDWATQEDDPGMPLVDPTEFLANEAEKANQLTKAGFQPVIVWIAVDVEYMLEEPNWPTRTLTIFQNARPSFLMFGQIDLVFGGWFPWDSRGSNGSEMLGNLAADFSHLPNGLVVGFTDDPNFVDSEGDRLGGKAYVYGSNPGLGFSIVENQSLTSTTYALRHELGHNYGMYHDTGAEICMMNYTYAYSVFFWDIDHQLDLINRNTRFTN